MSVSLPGSLEALQRQLAGPEAIDFYFAREFSLAHGEGLEHIEVWFHCLLALSVAQRQGHTCLVLSEIAGQHWFYDSESEVKGYSFPELPLVQKAVELALAQLTTPNPLVLDNGRLYSRRFWNFEQEVARALAERCKPESFTDAQVTQVQKIWPLLFSALPDNSQDWQQVATAGSLGQRFSIINGGPGTGKTYTVTRLMLALQAAHANSLTIQLAAPTGKAAQRLTESVSASLQRIEGEAVEPLVARLPKEATTLHRLLGMSRYGVDCRRDAQNPLNCDVLIVDEVSMVDLALMARTVRALPVHARLVLVGDAEQLPAVESGNVLEALVGSEVHSSRVSAALKNHIARLCPHLPEMAVSPSEAAAILSDRVHTLRTSQRFSGALADVAAAIQAQQAEVAWEMMTKAGPTDWYGSLSLEGVAQLPLTMAVAEIKALAQASFNRLITARDLNTAMQNLNDCRWLTPLRRGQFGSQALNGQIEQALGLSARAGPAGHYAGRPVMVLENHYALGLFNGDVGLVWPDASGRLKAWFEVPQGGYRAFSLARLPKVETVFAMTVHKSQGSEFEQVVLLVPPAASRQAESLCSKELLYTGLTRARKGCLLLSDKTRFSQVIHTRHHRFSGLRDILLQNLAGTQE
ncbi:exodeoxyribonuclease V subunit alpha [Alteromonas aestuariivivens]|uniref:RecBCD enzyme subunit RecD n=1 Tax=Alteromonas aestuariivivens TaxID=1938339 RepID=A0A3D8M4G9_9ALTE|nr:exodeoxyribonuclease V subunit alpha [Alteromonas aestuariivivens]RDV24470.1 exodeoxyribonuclease V subunit alpha [Alteromonas aestuariivivens]